MPSSAASQREDTRRQQDTRPISLFGRVTSYLTAPFSWLMGTNEDNLPTTPSDQVSREDMCLEQATSFFGRVKSYLTAPFSRLMGTNEDSLPTTPSPLFVSQPSVSTSTRPPTSTRTHAARTEFCASTRPQPSTFTQPFASARTQHLQVSPSSRQDSPSPSHSPSTLTLPLVSNSARPPTSTTAQPPASTSTRPLAAQPLASISDSPFVSASARPSASAQLSMSTRSQPSALACAQPSAVTCAQPSSSTSAQPPAPTSADERDGLGKRKRTAAVSPEIKEKAEEGEEGEEGEEEIQYLRRKSPEFKRRKYPNGLRSIYEALQPLPHYVPWPGPESLATHKPTDRYSVSLGPVLCLVGIIRTFYYHVFSMSIDSGLGSR